MNYQLKPAYQSKFRSSRFFASVEDAKAHDLEVALNALELSDVPGADSVEYAAMRFLVDYIAEQPVPERMKDSEA